MKLYSVTIRRNMPGTERTIKYVAMDVDRLLPMVNNHPFVRNGWRIVQITEEGDVKVEQDADPN